jgi:hypothetical protein
MNDQATSRWILAAGVAVRLATAFLLIAWLHAIIATMGIGETPGVYGPPSEGAAVDVGVGPFAPILILFGLVALAAGSGALLAALQRAAMKARPAGWIPGTVTSAVAACSAMVSFAMVVLLFVPQDHRWTMITVFFYANVLGEGLAILLRQRRLLAASPVSV